MPERFFPTPAPPALPTAPLWNNKIKTNEFVFESTKGDPPIGALSISFRKRGPGRSPGDQNYNKDDNDCFSISSQVFCAGRLFTRFWQ